MRSKQNFQRAISFLILAFNPALSGQTPHLLRVPLVNQDNFVWCWAASGEMVTAYYKKHIPKCKFVSDKVHDAACCPNGQPDDCSTTGTAQDLQALLTTYGFVAPQVSTTALNWEQATNEIDHKGPFLVTLRGTGEDHMVVVTGYMENSDKFLVINDPDPNGMTYRTLYDYQSQQTSTITGIGTSGQ